MTRDYDMYGEKDAVGQGLKADWTPIIEDVKYMITAPLITVHSQTHTRL